jgi:hypothetical protein
MSRAIDQVREWKHQHEHNTLQLMAQMVRTLRLVLYRYRFCVTN